jgi:hypothetical protein
MTNAALDLLIRLLHQPDATDDDIEEAARAFFQTLPTATPAYIHTAIQSLTPLVASDDIGHAGYAALVIGALLEHGYDPSPVRNILIDRIRAILTSCSIFAAHCRELVAADAEPDDIEAFEEVFPTAAHDLPKEAEAWEGLHRFWQPGIALFSLSTAARQASQDLRALTQPLVDFHEGAYWLDLILSTPNGEPILVIEPASQQGFLGTMTGVVDNFQLHTILMDVFPQQPPAQQRVAQQILDVALGNGPQQTDDSVTGIWNLYMWTALQPNGQLPLPDDKDSSQHWIWGEGHPQDIAIFQGYRVVLLGPPAYTRTWTSQRMFSALPAQITRDQLLSPAEVTQWLQQMAAAT